MRAYQITGSFGLENIKAVDLPEPTPGPGEVVLEMLAASLNYRDLLMIKGRYNPRQPLPLIPVSDGVGRVIALGEGVTSLKVGDRVCPLFAQGWAGGAPEYANLRQTLGGPVDGVLRQRGAFPASDVVKVPAYLSDAEAATLPCAALTAWSALVVHGALKAGESVLLQGTGGVSIFGLQISKLFGARAIITSSSDEKLERTKALGSDVRINYRTTPEWGKAVKAATGRRGVDHVVEVGGAGTLGQSLKAVKIGGQISVIGVLGKTSEALNITPILMGHIRLQGILVGHRQGFESMMRAFELAQLRPVVDKIYPWEDVRDALSHMEAGAHFGKICLTF